MVAKKVPFSAEQLQRYIKHARKINPKLNHESKKALTKCYKLLRENDIHGKSKTAYRITVRQLESLIRYVLNSLLFTHYHGLSIPM